MAQFHFLIFSIFLVEILAKRPFEILLDSLECTGSPKYVETAKCYVDKSVSPPHGFARIQMKQEITSADRYFVSIKYLRSKNESFTLLSSGNNDVCKFFEGKNLPKILNIVKRVLTTFGELPAKCPTYKDFNYDFKDITLNAEEFPPYVPEGGFETFFNVTNGLDLLYSVLLKGHIIYKKTWKL